MTDFNKQFDRKGQMEFGWLFSLILGAVIIFLAILFAGKIFGIGTQLSNVQMLREFDILLNPFSSIGSIASMTLSKSIDFPYEVELNITCSGDSQIIFLKQTKAKETSSYKIGNKYIFSKKFIKGKKIRVFSKPFEMPWRVDDLIYLVSDNYCFSASFPSEIKREINQMNASAIRIESPGNACKKDEIKVCYNSGTDCDIIVYENTKTISKTGEAPYNYATTALMYAAIFSDKQIYECNVNRLLNRMKNQVDIFQKQIATIKIEGCNTGGVENYLQTFKDEINNVISGARKISTLENTVNSIELASKNADCRVI